MKDLRLGGPWSSFSANDCEVRVCRVSEYRAKGKKEPSRSSVNVLRCQSPKRPQNPRTSGIGATKYQSSILVVRHNYNLSPYVTDGLLTEFPHPHIIVPSTSIERIKVCHFPFIERNVNHGLMVPVFFEIYVCNVCNQLRDGLLYQKFVEA